MLSKVFKCSTESYFGHVVNIIDRTVTDAEIVVKDGIIADITPCEVPDDAPYYLPGFIDSHFHIESSMMLPTEFARVARRHGTVGAVCDPH
ncbi:MAG: amidohydrolase family protein, partial [Bacteroidales bacterium]|nr:amidohydrolase family protein [Candidatus Cacconaster merdequi]